MNKLKQDEPPAAIIRQLNQLQKMGLSALREKYRELYGTETACGRPEIIRRRLAYRIQELHFGGLSQRENAELDAVLQDDPVILGVKLSEKKPKCLLRGTRLVRIWQGKRYEVTLRDNNMYEYNGACYKSLTAVAKAITGTHWNGKAFFGVK